MMTPSTDLPLYQLVAQQAATQPGFAVLTFLNQDRGGGLEEDIRTYADLHRNGQTLACALQKLGVQAGQQVALMMNNHPEFVEAMLATGRLGAVFVPVDPRSMGAKLVHMLDFTECTGVVCADYCVEAILAVVGDCPRLRWLIVVPSGLEQLLPASPALIIQDYRAVMATPGTPQPTPAPAMDAPMFMMFTSGTTGNPKAVVQSHRDYMAKAASYSRLNFTAEDGLYTGLSLTHINAQNTLRNALALGVRGVFSRKFTKSQLWDICRRYRCTAFSLLGGMIPEMYAIPEKPDDADNPVRFVFTSGMPAAIWKDFERRFGVTALEGYGSTEGGGLSNPPGVGPVGSIGKPSPDWEAAILDAGGQRLGPHQEGEICFRRKDGAPVNVHYFKNPEASRDKVRGGWLHMGDLGHIDEDGWFFFHHRVGGGVRRNGDFVNTALVEAVLSRSPLVADVFVYGVATARNVAGEKTLVAAVVPQDPATFEAEALLAWCRTRLEKNDVPEVVQVLAQIPKTLSEKPIEKACIELLGLGA
jgi:crotonobetaine/carnitine-CoA ligase